MYTEACNNRNNVCQMLATVFFLFLLHFIVSSDMYIYSSSISKVQNRIFSNKNPYAYYTCEQYYNVATKPLAKIRPGVTQSFCNIDRCNRESSSFFCFVFAFDTFVHNSFLYWQFKECQHPLAGNSHS